MSVFKLSKEEIKSLEEFSFKVDMEGFNYALENYGPKEDVFKPLYTLSVLKAEDWLEELRDDYDIPVS